VKSLAAIAAGLLRVGRDAKSSGSSYQVKRANLATGGGRRGVVPRMMAVEVELKL
jgi:hypothetical protein